LLRANNVGNAGPHVSQTFLNDVFTFLTEVGNAGRIVNTGTSSVNFNRIEYVIFYLLDKNNERPDWMTDLKHTDSAWQKDACKRNLSSCIVKSKP
jgi:hypothetical protein